VISDPNPVEKFTETGKNDHHLHIKRRACQSSFRLKTLNFSLKSRVFIHFFPFAVSIPKLEKYLPHKVNFHDCLLSSVIQGVKE